MSSKTCLQRHLVAPDHEDMSLVSRHVSITQRNVFKTCLRVFLFILMEDMSSKTFPTKVANAKIGPITYMLCVICISLQVYRLYYSLYFSSSFLFNDSSDISYILSMVHLKMVSKIKIYNVVLNHISMGPSYMISDKTPYQLG